MGSKDELVSDKKEMVNKVDHYGGTLVIDFIEKWETLPKAKANFSRTTAFKYLFRAGMKFPEKEIEDLEKVIWYAKREIERLSFENNKSES